ncbi:hypothetical protein PAMP_016792 [Pampus punctatissimus]
MATGAFVRAAAESRCCLATGNTANKETAPAIINFSDVTEGLLIDPHTDRADCQTESSDFRPCLLRRARRIRPEHRPVTRLQSVVGNGVFSGQEEAEADAGRQRVVSHDQM